MCCRLLLGHLGQVLTDFRLEICYREGLRLLQGIYFADTNLTIFSNIFFHYSHLRSHDWHQEDCPKDSLFKVEKNFRMFFCFGFAAPAAYRALCQSCLPRSSYKTTRFCNNFVNITFSSSDPTFR